jgi:hypothetical protein
MPIGPDTCLRVPAHVVTRVLDEVIALLDTNSGAYFTINEVGARLLQQSAEGRTLAQVALAVAEEFDVTAEEALVDLTELTEQLQQAGLVELA